MGAFLSTDGLVGLLTLTAMEIVLGIDNIVFIAILTGAAARRPAGGGAHARPRAGPGIRIGLLFAISWMMGLTQPLFAVLGQRLLGRDLILLGGGLFLIGKATHEIHDKLEGRPRRAHGARAAAPASPGPLVADPRCSTSSSRSTP